MDRDILAGDAAKTAAALRSQLNQMAAASQVLERSTESEKGRAYLAVINQSICRMLRIVGRMELGQRLSDDSSPRFSPKYVDLVPGLEHMSRRLEGILADIGITFTLQTPVRLLTCADSSLLQQMLLELISNLALAGTAISLVVTQEEGSLRFTLRDNGPGSADGRPRLPELLEEDEEQTSLELARRIAQLHGGSLVVSPGADLSLSMVVSIPVTEGASGQLESPRAPWRSGGFDPVLIAMSQLLPSRSFLPENLD